jgi:hypothetical protein
MSALLGLADHIYPAIPCWMKRRLRFFNAGWGDEARMDDGVQAFREWVERNGYKDHLASSPISLDIPLHLAENRVRGSFRSPLAEFLPPESREAQFELLLPEGGQPKAVVVQFGGIGDQTLMFRRIMLARRLLDANIATVLIVAPLYGSRRPAGQRLHYIETVELLLMQTVSLQSEALVILSWLRQVAFPSALLGVSGLSWGGTNAACCGAMWDGPIAIIAICSSPSFDPLLEGALDGDINWDALIASDDGDDEPGLSAASLAADKMTRAKRRLRAKFDYYSFERLVEAAAEGRANGNPRTSRVLGAPKAALHAGAQHDGFVLLRHSESLHGFMKTFVPRAKMVYVPGGHVSSFVFAPILAKLIPSTFDHLRKEINRTRLVEQLGTRASASSAERAPSTSLTRSRL